jgi:hypothetical protein
MARKIILREPTYYSPGDEKAFFDWLLSIACIKDAVGNPHGLQVTFKSQPGNLQLRDLFALLARYRMDVDQLSTLRMKRNAALFDQLRTLHKRN